MTKSIFSLLLLLIGFSGLAQPLDSVQIDQEWRYVYPVTERIDFDSDYYSKLGLTSEEFPIWMQWKIANDPRANLKSDDLKQALQRERFNRKEVTDSVYNKKNTYTSGGFYKLHSDKDYRRNQRLLYAINCRRLDFVPPVIRSLPDGKYVQFFEPYVTYDKASKSRIISQQVAAKFELVNNELQNQFQRFAPDNTLLVSGSFDRGFKTGNWTETTSFDNTEYDYSRRYPEIPMDNAKKTNYIQGLSDGTTYFYYGNRLTGIEHFKNGKQVGEVIDIHYIDSIVYDLYKTFDPLVNYASLEAIYSHGIDYSRLVEGKKNMATFDYLERIHPDLFTSYATGEITAKHYPDSVLLTHKTYSQRIRSSQLFESGYKIYDRKTKRLIFQCRLDTVTKLYSGSSWYLNGQKFDTIWTDPLTMNLEWIIYDTTGGVIYNSLKGDQYDQVKIIDGYKAYPSYGPDKTIAYYYYEASKLDSDTIFRKFHWDPSGKMTSMQYRLKGDLVQYEIIRHGEDYYEFDLNRDRKLVTYSENGIKLTAFIPLKEGEPVVSITVNDQPYEGPIEFKQLNKEKEKIGLKNNKLVLCSAYSSSGNIENGVLMYSQDKMRYSSMELMQQILLNFEERDLNLKTVSGTFKNNRLEGRTILEDARHHQMELDYTNGLPTGKILIYRKRSKYTQDLSAHNYVDKSCHFSEKRFHKKYLYKSYTFKNGILDGPLVFYTSGGDTSGIIPFVNGVKNGKVFQYEEMKFTTAEFRNDTLANNLEIYAIRSAQYDTLWSISLDSQGNLITGLQKTLSFRSQLMRSVEHRMRYRDLGNDIIEVTSSEDNRIYEREFVKDSHMIKRDLIQENEVKYTEEFNDTILKPNYYGLLRVLDGVDYVENGIVWNNESDKKHNFNPDHIIYDSDYPIDKYPRYITKYFSNGVVLREGAYVYAGRHIDAKNGVWKVNDYNGRKLYEINYKDSTMKINGENRFVIGIQTEFDSLGNVTSTRAVLSEAETYECSSDDYYAERQYITLNSKVPSRMNGLTKNYYDNGALMNEGKVINGIPEGLWKFYTPDGKLTRLGSYQGGLENGKWLFGDLGEKAYIGEVCIDPNDPEYEFTLHQLEMDKEIEVVIYKNGEELGSSSFSSIRRSRSRSSHIVEPNF